MKHQRNRIKVKTKTDKIHLEQNFNSFPLFLPHPSSIQAFNWEIQSFSTLMELSQNTTKKTQRLEMRRSKAGIRMIKLRVWNSERDLERRKRRRWGLGENWEVFLRPKAEGDKSRETRFSCYLAWELGFYIFLEIINWLNKNKLFGSVSSNQFGANLNKMDHKFIFGNFCDVHQIVLTLRLIRYGENGVISFVTNMSWYLQCRPNINVILSPK